jgi:hypothetical protein
VDRSWPPIAVDGGDRGAPLHVGHRLAIGEDMLGDRHLVRRRGSNIVELVRESGCGFGARGAGDQLYALIAEVLA